MHHTMNVLDAPDCGTSRNAFPKQLRISDSN